MKKKILAVSLATVFALSMTACGKKVPANQETPESTVEATIETETTVEAETTEETPDIKPAANVPGELSDDIYSFQVSVNGTVHQFPMWFSDFEALGWTYAEDDLDAMLTSNQYSPSERWERDGVTVYAELANLSMNSIALKDAMVAGITFDKYYMDECDWEILLPGGIQYGISTRDDIIAAYGDPSDEYEGDMYYKMTYDYDYYQDIELYVYKESGVLQQIEIENMIELEGADNSVNSEVPEIVKNYVAPTKLGDDLYQFNIELEGKLYTIPCPVSELVANGFTVVPDNENGFGADGYGWVTLKYNNQSYHTIVHNYADYATTAENCFVTSIKSSEYEPDFKLTIPCNIKRGDSEATVKKALENFNYEVEESSDFTYYEVYSPDGYKTDRFTITVKGGEVTIIEVDHAKKPNY